MKKISLLVVLILSACMPEIHRITLAEPIANIAEIAEIEVEEMESLIFARMSENFPVHGGTLRLSMRIPSTFNPLLNEDATVARIFQLMYEPLIIFDDELRPVPHLAELEFSFNGANVIVTIRDDAFWNDGSPITAEDLAYSIEVLRNAPADAIYSQFVQNFSTVEVLDFKSARITFSTIVGGAAYMFNFPIIPAHFNDNEVPVSNGLFMLESVDFTETLTLVKNPYTFRVHPYIENISIITTSNAETDLTAFDRMLVDVYNSSIPDWARHYSVNPVQFAEYPAMHFDFIGFNFARSVPALHDFRQAIYLSLNVESLISDIFLTHAVPTRTPIHPMSWLSYTNLPESIYDVALARSIAGRAITHATRHRLWSVDEYNTNQPLVVLVNQENPERVRMARHLVNQMTELGFDTELVSVSFDEYVELLEAGEFDVFLGGYNLSMKPDLRFALHSGSPDNVLAYSNANMDYLLEIARLSGTDSSFQRVISDIQLHIVEDIPLIPLAFRHASLILDPRIRGDLSPSISNIFMNIENWHIAP
ncbi:MAG: ABC transporter substrate-binding protein [Turicibacter sp.]|nr:ABC transporter substrate-binding protein [Turicibacter sp.]